MADDGSQATPSDRDPRLVKLMISALAVVAGAALAVVPATSATAASPRTHRHHARVAAGCAGASASVGNTSPAVLRSAVVCLVNQQRARHHLPALQPSLLLNHSAQAWTDAMVTTDQFTHGNFAGRISATGYVWRSAGENIATGFATPRTVVRAWMASTGHCQNILNPTYRNVGTGINPHPVKGWATGFGTWTQDFALGMHQSAPSGNFGPMDGCPY
jgi:uncharacterized protein YkwD